jgi:nucleoside-diphosphate-sugar epimerase
MDRVFIVGCGYVGVRVADRERDRGREAWALVRSQKSADRLHDTGLQVLTGDLDRPANLRELPTKNSWVYYLVPPPGRGVTDPRMEMFLRRMEDSSRPRKIVSISTTGVYGDCQGAWIREDHTPCPQTDRARRRLAGEQVLQAWSERTGVPAVILRVSGIYGPDKLPVARLQQKLPVLCETESPWSNRIHVDDLVEACLAAADRGRPGAVYHVADGHPSTMTDYFNQVADALGLPRPPQISLDEAGKTLSDEMLSYLAESKRLDITRLKDELGVVPRYPTLAAGLSASLSPDDRTS